MIINSMYALIATLSFGILFNIRGKKLFIASIGGGLGWFVYLLSQNGFKLSNVFSLFVAATATAVYSEIMARVFKTPVTYFVICGIIPMVPGNGMYYTMYESINGNAAKSISTGIQTFASAGAIAAGIILVSSATKLISFRNKLIR